jgi:2,3-bisphosphoglycerate-independent phosphoglycerate mutase
MKYLVILTDGAADYPIEELGGQTPLQYAKTPFIDELARRSIVGKAATIPEGFPPGSDVANLSVLGYDPALYYTGRSPLEAVSMGVELNDEDLALRCNLVTLSGEEDYAAKTMSDYSAGEIETADARQLIAAIQSGLGDEQFVFHPGISYRHLLVWKGGFDKEVLLTPPHDISGQKIGAFLPRGRDGDALLQLMRKSVEILGDHSINKSLLTAGHEPATSIWFWGEGRKPSLPSFAEKYSLRGSVVCAVDLVRGLGISAGLTPITVEGATGGVKTNFKGKAEAALRELESGQDFVFVHIESPDESGHQGNLNNKLWSIEQIDSQVIGTIVAALDRFEEIKIMILPDHPTPLAIKTHSSEPVPFMIYDSRRAFTEGSSMFDEVHAEKGPFIELGHTLMDYFIRL